MIVADTNTIAYLLLKNTKSEIAQQVYQKDPDWAAPVLWRSEFRNVLALYLRGGEINFEEALSLAETAQELMYGQEYEVGSIPVLSLVNASRCSAYDCEFVALALDLQTKVVTSDKLMLKEFHDIALSPEAFITAV